MGILKKILYGILGFFILFCGVIVLCAVKPEMSEQIAETLKLNENDEYPMSPVPGRNPEQSNGGTADGAVTNTLLTEEPEGSGQSGYENQPMNRPVSDTGQDGEIQPGTDLYADPGTYGVIAPASVVGRSGYEPIQEESSEIDDEEAAEIQEEIGFGETGDGLTFDIWFYPYYAMLDDTGQHLYRQIYANAMALNERFAPIENVPASALRDVFAAVYNDHPELFFMETAYASRYKSNGECVEIDLKFNSTAKNLEQSRNTFEAKAKEIIDGAQELGSDYEKEKYVHDTLIAQIDYVDSAAMNQSAYSALVNGKTVCAGYARAFQYILQTLEIPCYYCTGYAGESHAWNIVCLDDGYYNVDATWDDAAEGSYDYFNKSDWDYAVTHLRQELSVNLPPCNGTAYRNLEVSDDEEEDVPREDARRSLEELGLTAENTLISLEDYYNDCYEKASKGGKGRYSFQNVITGKVLCDNVYNAYQNGGYRQGYMDKVLEELEASDFRLDWSIEELQNGYYLVTHEVLIQ